VQAEDPQMGRRRHSRGARTPTQTVPVQERHFGKGGSDRTGLMRLLRSATNRFLNQRRSYGESLHQPLECQSPGPSCKRDHPNTIRQGKEGNAESRSEAHNRQKRNPRGMAQQPKCHPWVRVLGAGDPLAGGAHHSQKAQRTAAQCNASMQHDTTRSPWWRGSRASWFGLIGLRQKNVRLGLSLSAEARSELG
jgi:hypothetical protein